MCRLGCRRLCRHRLDSILFSSTSFRTHFHQHTNFITTKRQLTKIKFNRSRCRQCRTSSKSFSMRLDDPISPTHTRNSPPATINTQIFFYFIFYCTWLWRQLPVLLLLNKRQNSHSCVESEITVFRIDSISIQKCEKTHRSQFVRRHRIASYTYSHVHNFDWHFLYRISYVPTSNSNQHSTTIYNFHPNHSRSTVT